jgi:hypothetical protein
MDRCTDDLTGVWPTMSVAGWNLIAINQRRQRLNWILRCAHFLNIWAVEGMVHDSKLQ